MPYFSHENNFSSRKEQAYRLQLIAIKSISLNEIYNLILKLKTFIYSLCDNVMRAYILICIPFFSTSPLLPYFFTDLLGVIRVACMNMGVELYLLEKGQLTSRHITGKKKKKSSFLQKPSTANSSSARDGASKATPFFLSHIVSWLHKYKPPVRFSLSPLVILLCLCTVLSTRCVYLKYFVFHTLQNILWKRDWIVIHSRNLI